VNPVNLYLLLVLELLFELFRRGRLLLRDIFELDHLQPVALAQLPGQRERILRIVQKIKLRFFTFVRFACGSYRWQLGSAAVYQHWKGIGLGVRPPECAARARDAAGDPAQSAQQSPERTLQACGLICERGSSLGL